MTVAYLLLVALTWATTRAGATTPVDLGVVAAVVVAAFLLSGKPSRPGPAVLAVGAFLAWTIFAHPDQATDMAGLWLPVLVVLCVLVVLTVLRTAEQRAILLDGLVVIGTVQAIGAGVQAAVLVAERGIPADGLRAASLIGNANALGVLLVATFLVTLRTRPPGAPVLLVVQGLGVLLTGSRLAIGVAIVVAVAAVRGPLRRWKALVGCWVVVAGAVVVGRFVASGADRLALWRAALGEFARAPITGRGPAPVAYLVTGIGPTTHAHNEALQIAVEYGVVGLGLLIIAGVVVVRCVARWDVGLLVATVALAASGLTDFGLRIPAIALTAAVLGAFAASPNPRAARSDRDRPPSDPPATAAAPLEACAPGSAGDRRRAGAAVHGSGARS